MATAFHSKGLLLSQDVMPFNTDYNIKELSKYIDYFCLMAYDEYSLSSDAGPISSQKWIEVLVYRFFPAPAALWAIPGIS